MQRVQSSTTLKMSIGRGVLAVALGLFAFSCTDSGPAPTAVDRTLPTQDPLFGFNGPGSCMDDDNNAFGPGGPINCTSNDITIAETFVTSVNGAAFTPGDVLLCTPGETINLGLTLRLEEGANSSRQDVGVWVANDKDAEAHFGSCNHYTIDVGAPAIDEANPAERDACAGIDQQSFFDLPLTGPAIPALCPAAGNTITIGACVAWNVPADDSKIFCPDPTPPANDPSNGFRAASLPTTPAKCNCDPFTIDVVIAGQITIVKDAVPNNAADFAFTTSGGGLSSFSLDDDGDATLSNTKNFTNLNPTTGNPRVITETPLAGWALTDIACTGGTFLIGADADFDAGDTFVSVTVASASSTTCTFTNTKLSSLTIIKDAIPNDAQDFAFTTTGTGLSSFSLDDDGDATLSNTKVFNNLAAGAYTVVEGAVSGWSLTGLSCSGGGANTTTSTATRTASIGFDPGEDVTCTFTNTKLGSLTIIKDAIPNNAQDFGFSSTGGLSPSTFNLDDDGDATLSNTQTFTGLLPGGITVSENAPPSGWGLTNLTCTGGGANTTTSLATRTATIGLDAGENITCTFENTAGANLTIIKDAIPNDPQDFAYTSTGGLSPSSFSLDDDADATLSNTRTYSNIAPGAYTVTEGAVGGWSLTNLTCTGGGANTSTSTATRTATIGLDPGENVTCTFENTKLSTLTIIKDAIPNDAQDFAFTTTGTGLSGFSLDDDGDATLSNTKVFSDLTAGSYSVIEGAVGGWALTNLTCTGGGANTTTSTATRTASIGLDPGENVTCTFENTKLATVTIIKDDQNPATDAEDFAFSTTGTGFSSFNLDDDADATLSNTKVFSDLLPGARTVAEGAEANWALTGITCVGGGANTTTSLATRTASIGVDAGESITCTFVNQRLARLIVEKNAPTAPLQSFDFSRTGIANFALIEGQQNNSGFTLAPGVYRVCELSLAVAWAATATLNGANQPLFNPDAPASLGNLCADITLAYGDDKIIIVTNTPPPGGATRTIGYWKNWSSCTGGKQYQKAQDNDNLAGTLDFYLGGAGLVSIYPIGNITSLTCLEAVALLSKSALDGSNRPGDPVYNMVAQLLGAKLNRAANAGTCPVVDQAFIDAQALLLAIGFDGNEYFSGKNQNAALSDAQRAQAITLAGIFGSYNEGTLGAPCPTHAG